MCCCYYYYFVQGANSNNTPPVDVIAMARYSPGPYPHVDVNRISQGDPDWAIDAFRLPLPDLSFCVLS